MIIRPLLISILEAAINHYLSLDEDAPCFLEPLAGKIIALHIQTFDTTLFLCPTRQYIQLLENYQGSVDTTISGTVSTLGLMSLSSKPMRSVFSGEITIEGDTNTGKKFQELFEKLDIDLEEQLSRYTGDIVAHQISRGLRTSQKWGAEAMTNLKLNTQEYLQDESRDLPAPAEMDIFFRQVDTVRADYDRLQSRVERLKRAPMETA